MLLTQERINALARINRFAGWTSRPYSVLEHSVIGARLIHDRETQRAFLLHDLEESVFGDIISPVKARYMTDRYRDDVRTWNRDLAAETGVPLWAMEGLTVKWVDAVMIYAEWQCVYAGERRNSEANGWAPPFPDHSEDDIRTARRDIESEFYAGDLAVQAFWQMWSGS